jgi:1,4-alpha-glucan branching enzyme
MNQTCKQNQTAKRTQMNAVYEKPTAGLYSARNSLKPINFYCASPRAQLVQIAGDFNHWQPMPMHKQVDGLWFVQVLLAHGHHLYHFLVDGRPTLDPQALGTARDGSNQPVSLVAVS